MSFQSVVVGVEMWLYQRGSVTAASVAWLRVNGGLLNPPQHTFFYARCNTCEKPNIRLRAYHSYIVPSLFLVKVYELIVITTCILCDFLWEKVFDVLLSF